MTVLCARIATPLKIPRKKKMKLYDGIAGFLVGMAMLYPVHTIGHLSKATEMNVRISLSGQTEEWQTDDSSKATQINMGGFELENIVVDASQNTDFRKANMLRKVLYAINPRLLYPDYRFNGDMAFAKETSGNPFVKEIVLTTILWDYLKLQYPKALKNYDLRLTSTDGNIGLMYVYYF